MVEDVYLLLSLLVVIANNKYLYVYSVYYNRDGERGEGKKRQKAFAKAEKEGRVLMKEAQGRGNLSLFF